MAPPLEKLSSLKCHSLILRPILRKSAIVIFRQQFKMFDPNNFTLSSEFSFQTVWPLKRKGTGVSLSTFPYNLFIYFLDQMGSQLAYFLKLHNV